MKYLKTIFCLIILFVCFIIIQRAIGYYMPPKEQKVYSISKKQNNDTIRIALIGDSWAFFHQPYDRNLSYDLTRRLQRAAKAESHGTCGLTSKELYNRIFEDNEMKEFLSKGFDYCIISAGVNDTYRKLSKDYYKESMDYIIKFMLSNSIKPVILEIPDYNIDEAYKRQTCTRKTIRRISMIINSTPMDCKQEFRSALDKLISDKYQGKVYVLKYKEWNLNYFKDLTELYRPDGMHLNSKGYEKLDNSIAYCIAQICSGRRKN